MTDLGLPFRKFERGTRLDGWVLWLLAALAIMLIASAWAGSRLWLTRDTLSPHIPREGVALIRITPNRANVGDLRSWMGGQSLVSEAGLSLDDVLPHVSGEMGILVLEDGKTAIMLRSESAPNALIEEGSDLRTLEPAPGLYILSSANLSPEISNQPAFPPLATLWSTDLGSLTVRNGNGWLHGPIRLAGDRIEIALDGELLPAFAGEIPEEALVAASLESDFFGYFGQNSDFFANKREKTNILAIESENRISFLLYKDVVVTKDLLKDMLRSMSAMASPSGMNRSLPDNSLSTDMVIDPSAVTLERVTLEGREAFRGDLPGDRELLGATGDGWTAVTNDANLLAGHLQGESWERVSSCGRSGLISLEQISGLMPSQSWVAASQLIRRSTGVFRRVGWTNNGGRTTLHLCR